MIAYLRFKKPVIIGGASAYDHVIQIEKITLHESFIQVRYEGGTVSVPLSNVKKIEVTENDEDIEYEWEFNR